MNSKKILGMAAALVLGLSSNAQSMEFKMQGEWGMYFSAGSVNLVQDKYAAASGRSTDRFDPSTRLRLQLDAIASESLSGTVYFEIGPTAWGKAANGAALGTDGTSVEVKRAYLDWKLPTAETLSLRMGLQGIGLPHATFGPAILSEGNESAGIIASWRINDTVSLTTGWFRPYNDNFAGRAENSTYARVAAANYLDNMDIFPVIVPITMDGIKVTPWVALGMLGQNTMPLPSAGGVMRFHSQSGLLPRDAYLNADYLREGAGLDVNDSLHRNRAYGTLFWAGLPVIITSLDPWNLELDFNYGYSSGFGTYSDARLPDRRNDTRREGWLVRALAEYKTNWGLPGVYAWYSSGDDGNTRNGSEIMPSIAPGTGPTSFGMDQSRAEGNITYFDAIGVTVAGTWGAGARLKDFSFLENLKHTLQATYYGGTNDVAMAKALGGFRTSADSRSAGMGWTRFDRGTSIYMTTADYMVEFNIDSEYKIYENLKALLYMGYIINGMDKDTWKWSGDQKADAWRVSLNMVYNF